MRADVGVRGDADALVELALRTGELDRVDEVRLRRQLLRDRVLRAAQDERPDPLAQRRDRAAGARAIAAILDRLAKLERELVAMAEQAGVEKVEQRPQLAEVVLDRRARQADLVARVERADRLGRLRVVVLDRVRLVEDEQVERDLASASRSRATSG